MLRAPTTTESHIVQLKQIVRMFLLTTKECFTPTKFGIKCDRCFCSSATHMGQKGDFFFRGMPTQYGRNAILCFLILVRFSLRGGGPSIIYPSCCCVHFPPAHFCMYFMCGHDSVFYFPLTAVPCDQPYRSPSHNLSSRFHFPLLHPTAELPYTHSTNCRMAALS